MCLSTAVTDALGGASIRAISSGWRYCARCGCLRERLLRECWHCASSFRGRHKVFDPHTTEGLHGEWTHPGSLTLKWSSFSVSTARGSRVSTRVTCTGWERPTDASGASGWLRSRSAVALMVPAEVHPATQLIRPIASATDARMASG